MKIKSVTLNNYAQYFGSTKFDLSTEENKNIILIGGENGYGKTNFITSIVWALYGRNIEKVDEIFKVKIKENYSKFLADVFNTEAKHNGENIFSVELEITDLAFNLPDSNFNDNSIVILKREYNYRTKKENIVCSIRDKDAVEEIPEEDLAEFIDEYIVPINAAKFVFFDAEKISEIANLGTKDQGQLMNEALGQILGLDLYKKLHQDLRFLYDNVKRKEGKDSKLKQEIDHLDNEINSQNNTLTKNKDDYDLTEKKIAKREKEFKETEKWLKDHGVYEQVDLKKIKSKRAQLIGVEDELKNKLQSTSHLIPFCISAPKLKEVITQIDKEESFTRHKNQDDDFDEKSIEFLESLFNKPPFPDPYDLTLSGKLYYTDKAKKLLANFFNQSNTIEEPKFKLDLTPGDTEFVRTLLDNVSTSSEDFIKKNFGDFNHTKYEIRSIERKIKKVEEQFSDDLYIEYASKKEDLKDRIDALNVEKGRLQSEIDTCNRTIKEKEKTRRTKVDLIDVSDDVKKQIDLIARYMKIIENFIEQQKKAKCEMLENNITEEYKNLTHKNQVAKISVNLLPGDNGLEIQIWDHQDHEIPQESLSAGEKQLFISAVIKGIFNESVHELPVFIDTPLGRLDRRHRDNILQKYYPTLAKQVVVLSTNEEITPDRFKKIEHKVSHSYLLNNDSTKTKLKSGYYN